jgi:hypothetical protein
MTIVLSNQHGKDSISFGEINLAVKAGQNGADQSNLVVLQAGLPYPLCGTTYFDHRSASSTRQLIKPPVLFGDHPWTGLPGAKTFLGAEAVFPEPGPTSHPVRTVPKAQTDADF